MRYVPYCPVHRRSIAAAAIFSALLLGIITLSASAARARSSAAPVFTGGIIASDTTWTTPITVTSPITISAGAALTIAPGVEVRFYPGTWLRVEGRLNARGTQAQQIHMVAAPIAPETMPWQGLIAAQPSSDIHLQSVTIKNAVAGLTIKPAGGAQAGQNGPPARIEVLDSLFDSNGTGVLADYGGTTATTTLTLRNNLLMHNETGMLAIGLSGKHRIKLNHNSFVGNGIGLRAIGQGHLRAQQQWWGSASGPRFGDTATCAAAPGAGDIVCGLVDAAPWSTRPAGRVILGAGAGGVIESSLGVAALSDDDTLPSSTATLTVPAGAFAQPVDLLISARALSELPAGLPGQPTQLAFEITAMAGGQEIHRFAGGRSLTLAIDYATGDLNRADPAKLRALYWDEASNRWSAAGLTTAPDPANHRIIIRLEHLSRFHVSGLEQQQTIYLPLIRQ